MNPKSLWPLFLFLVAFVVCAIVFIDVLPTLAVLQAPDAAPSLVKTSLLRRMLPWMNGSQTMITHDDLLKVLPALAYHELSFIVSTALLALAMGAYLRTIGLPLIACFGGGLAMAFSGYHFTLFNAGHRGYFIMMPYAIFLFALVERAIRTPHWFYFALMPICAICGLSTQPDVLLLILLFFVAYSLLRVVMIIAEIGFKSYFTTRWRQLLFGIAVLIITSGAVGYRTVEHVLTVTMAGREKQISQATQTPQANATQNDAQPKDKAANDGQWIFATNWSLPPEAMAEFVAPCLRGLDTQNPKGPYWGRLGQTIGWEQTQQGFSNYRQHALYLGAIQISLAFFAIIVAIWPRFRRQKSADSTLNLKHDPLTAITIFWLIAGVIAIMLALGRYAPFYKFFYALPHMDKIRAPVKFLHVTEIAVSILFAIGLARLLDSTKTCDSQRLRKIGIVTLSVLAVAALVCVIARLAFNAEGAAAIWTSMNIPTGAVRSTLAGLFKGALMRAAWMFALVAIALGLSLLPETNIRTRAILPCILLVICAAVFDMAEIGRRYVVGKDVSYVSQSNPITRTFEQRGPIDGLSYSYLQLTNQPLPGNIPFIESLSVSGLACMDPVATDTPETLRVQTYYAFQNDRIKRWKFWGTAAVLTNPQTANEMKRANVVKVVGLYDMDERLRLVSPKNLQSAQVAVVEPVDIIPSIAVFHSWRVAPKAEALSLIADANFDMDHEIVVSGDKIKTQLTDKPYTPATWVLSPLQTKGSLAKISVDTEAAGMLVVRENSLRNLPLTATVNGTPTPLHTANGLFLCVPVEAGKSTVVIRPTISATATAGTFAGLAFALFTIIALLRSEFNPKERGLSSP